MYLYEVDKGVPGTELLKRFPQYSCRSIYRHASKPFDCNEDDKKKYNRGHPPKFNSRDSKSLKRSANVERKRFSRRWGSKSKQQKGKTCVSDANIFPIPPRSPQMNPIESIFSFTKQKLH